MSTEKLDPPKSILRVLSAERPADVMCFAETSSLVVCVDAELMHLQYRLDTGALPVYVVCPTLWLRAIQAQTFFYRKTEKSHDPPT